MDTIEFKDIKKDIAIRPMNIGNYIVDSSQPQPIFANILVDEGSKIIDLIAKITKPTQGMDLLLADFHNYPNNFPRNNQRDWGSGIVASDIITRVILIDKDKQLKLPIQFLVNENASLLISKASCLITGIPARKLFKPTHYMMGITDLAQDNEPPVFFEAFEFGRKIMSSLEPVQVVETEPFSIP